MNERYKCNEAEMAWRKGNEEAMENNATERSCDPCIQEQMGGPSSALWYGRQISSQIRNSGVTNESYIKYNTFKIERRLYSSKSISRWLLSFVPVYCSGGSDVTLEVDYVLHQLSN